MSEEVTLPDGWTRATVGKLFRFSYGKGLTAKNRTPGEFPVYSSAGLVGTHSEPLTNGPTVIVGRKGAAGNVTFSPTACWVIDTAYYAEPSTDFDPQFVAYQLSAGNLRSLDQSTAIPSLTKKGLDAVPFVVPPLEEQGRIVRLVDRLMSMVDNGISEFGKAEAHIDALERSLFHASLNSDRTKGDDLEDWATEPLENLIEKLTSGSRDWKPYYGKGTGVFVMAQNVRPRKLDLANPFHVDPPKNDPARARSAVKEDDVLITIVGAGTGTVARVPAPLDDHWVCQSVALIRPKPSVLSGKFLELYLAAPEGGRAQLNDLIYGQGRPHLGFNDLKGLRIPKPPLDVQKNIVNDFDRRMQLVNHLRAQIAEAKDRARLMQKSILQLALSGAYSVGVADEELSSQLDVLNRTEGASAVADEVFSANNYRAIREAP